MTDDIVTLSINGQIYDGWTDITIETGLKDCAGKIDMPVTERWAGKQPPTPWQIKPFDKVVVMIGADIAMTGYVEGYNPSYAGTDHNVRVSGRSKTCDLIDCMPDVGAGQFSGSKLDAIARAICAKFGISVTVQCDVGDAFPDATLEKTETAFSFLEKLARQRSVLLTDDEKGNLVITQAGKGGISSGALIEGDNILSASAKLSAEKRFQQYVVLSQTPLSFDGQEAHTDIVGTATDAGCPRYRRFAEMAEDPADDGMAQKRANWRKLHNYGECTEATITVQGFRQPNGKLWTKNQLIPVKSPMLAVDLQLLISEVKFSMSDRTGRTTQLTVAPKEAFTPDPPKGGAKSKGNSAPIWTEQQSHQ